MIGLLITWSNLVFFLMSSMVLGLLDLLHIFLQLYLIELLRLLTGLGLLELWHFIYPRFLTGFGMLIFFTNLSLWNFRSFIWPYFFLSQGLMALSGSRWNSSQEYPVNAGVPHGSILGHKLFLLYINDLSDDIICDNAIYADNTTL